MEAIMVSKVKNRKRALTMQELRSMMPKKLNAYGKWFFSEDKNKFNIEVHDMRAVLE
jgi:hypothetical protein